MRLVTHGICAVLVLALASYAAASDVFGVTNHGGGTQIWMNVGDFDSASPQFVDQGLAGSLSGGSYQFQQYSNSGDKQEWYGEYTIDPADVPGVTLSGTWHFWVRGYMKLGTTGNVFEESDYLFVKGDDATGATWGADALAAADNADDRIVNEWANSPGCVGVDAWGWGSNAQWDTGLELKNKDFNLVDGVITFRVNERESADSNLHLDVICWSTVDDSAYVPSDADYIAIPEPVTLSLLLPGVAVLLRRRK